MSKVFYDHNCRFCKKIKNTLSNLDVFNCFEWLPNSEYDFDENKYNITQEGLDTSIVLITTSNTVYIEFYACRYIMLYIECLRRGYKVQNYLDAWNNIPEELMGDYTPTDNDRKIIRQRIKEKL